MNARLSSPQEKDYGPDTSPVPEEGSGRVPQPKYGWTDRGSVVQRDRKVVRLGELLGIKI